MDQLISEPRPGSDPPESTNPISIVASFEINNNQADQNQKLGEELLDEDDTDQAASDEKQKIWGLFKSLNCVSCTMMYNNKQRKPQIICANNHLLCKSCHSNLKKTSRSCLVCGIPLLKGQSSTTHESIQNFLKVYTQIYDERKKSNEQKKRKKAELLQFQVPKNLRAILIILCILLVPWLFLALKTVTSLLTCAQQSIISFSLNQFSQITSVWKTIATDWFYIRLFTNKDGQYVYYGHQVLNLELYQTKNDNAYQRAYANAYQQEHRDRIRIWLSVRDVINFITNIIANVFSFVIYLLEIANYIIHFLIFFIIVLKFHVTVAEILFKLQAWLPFKSAKSRLNAYIEILDSNQNSDYSIVELEDLLKLTNFQLYLCLLIRNYAIMIIKFENIKKVNESLDTHLYNRQKKKLAKKQQQNKVHKCSHNHTHAHTCGKQNKTKLSF